jgi:hypothetical protein
MFLQLSFVFREHIFVDRLRKNPTGTASLIACVASQSDATFRILVSVNPDYGLSFFRKNFILYKNAFWASRKEFFSSEKVYTLALQ